ncbi:YncE family protein [Pseudomonas sp. S49]|uniref:YncE family protein n=1 Tax=Pseudomonas sp. S49 TaxID=1573720 RepID=UPI00132F4C18|nr:YncE family protein [Pseudomonas sp. S49]QHF51138.1 hypothetical protein PspS49_16395 [Pseudomonas sp. S49]
MANPNKPLLLAELGIPGRSKDPVSKDPDVWGINIAAALGNFPLHGLQCQAGPWGNMASGDRLTIFWGTGLDAGGKTVLKDEVDTQLRMFVPSRHMVDGQFAVSYVVKPLGGTDQPSEVMQVLVKLTRPGGHDNNGDGGHSKLIMIIPQDILDGGIDEEIAKKGVPISIGKADGTPPYPYAAAGDICRVSWGGIFVLSEPLTQEQAEGKAPIIISITEAIIKEAGDAPGVAVVFEVYDKVFNRSEDWSPEQRVVVAVDATRLIAPLLKETLNNVLDVDQLGDADGTVQIIATDKASFEIGDIPFIRIKGTPVEGAPIDLEVEGAALTSVPSIIEIKAPNAVLRQLAKSQITLSYRLKKADGTADLKSKSQFIRAIGEVQRLAAPIMLDEDSGALDPTLAQVRLEIPFDKSFAEGQVLKIFMLGTTPGLKPYLPDLPLRLITRNDIVAAKPLSYSIDGKHLAPVNGGTAEFYYQQLLADAVLATLDKYAATRAIRESIHTDILQVGEPRLELPEPVVAGVVDGVLPADTAGTTLTVPYTETVKGDEVFMFWIGSITGEYPDSIKLNEFTAGKEVPFTIPAEEIKGNEGGTVIARYEIKRADGRTSYAEPLEFSVGVALENPLPLPQMPEATGNGASVTLAPLDAQAGARVIVAYTGMNETHNIKLSMLGTPGVGSPEIPAKPGVASGSVEFLIPAEAIAANIGNETKTFTLSYEVTAGQTIPSLPLTVSVTPLPATELDKISIEQAEGTVLDLSKVTLGATILAGVWAFIAANQRVGLNLKGTKSNGDAFHHVVWPWPSSYVNQNWFNSGQYTHTLAYNAIKDLADGSRLELHFKAALTLSREEAEAIDAPVKVYTIRAVEDIVPTIDSVKGTLSNDDILDGDITVETELTLKGMASKLQTIHLFDNNTLQDTLTVDAEGIWSTSYTAGVGNHKITAQGDYGSNPTSTAYNFEVIPEEYLTFKNAPYTAAPAGRIKDIKLQLRTVVGDNPVTGIVTLTLPDGFLYADGGCGEREFSTGSDGVLTISSIKAPIISGDFSLTAERLKLKAAATTTVTKLGEARKIVLEKEPWGLALSDDGTRLYITTGNSGSLFVIDTSNYETIKKHANLTGNRGIALDKNERYSYIGNFAHNSVTQLELHSGAHTKVISAQKLITDVILSADDSKLYTCNRSSNSISIITLHDLKSVHVTVGFAPRKLAMSPDQAYVYASNTESNFISAINTDSGLATSIAIAATSHDIAFSPDGDFAYAVTTSGVAVIDTKQQKQINFIEDVGGWGISVSPDGKSLSVCNQANNSVRTISLPSGVLGPAKTVGTDPRQLIHSKDGSRLYVCNYGENTISVIEI